MHWLLTNMYPERRCINAVSFAMYAQHNVAIISFLTRLIARDGSNQRSPRSCFAARARCCWRGGLCGVMPPRRPDGICFPDPAFASGRSCLKIWAERSERLPQLLGQLVGVAFSAFEAAASNFEAAFRFQLKTIHKSTFWGLPQKLRQPVWTAFEACLKI